MRKNKFYKIIAIFLLINMLELSFHSTLVYALTGGPSQAEFTSYEPIGSSDMVNLMTGDFTYNMPLVNVPGPEGNFALPLTYRAGIGPEQEASWVGLGWNINAGAIARSLNQYPDDARGVKNSGSTTDPDKDLNYVTNVGIGAVSTVDNYLFYQRTWNSVTGTGGAVSLFGLVSASWSGDGSNSTTILGVTGTHNPNGKSGVTIDVAQTTQNIISIGSMIMGGAGMANAGAAFAIGNTMMGAAQAYSGYVDAKSSGQSASQGYMGYRPIEDPSSNFWHKKVTYVLDQTRTEQMHGTLYLGAQEDIAPVPGGSLESSAYFPIINGSVAKFFKSNGGPSATTVASDMHVNVSNVYAHNVEPTSLAHDFFSVMGNTITGAIQPYRMDVGSLAYPRQMSEYEYKFNLLPFVPKSDYKVQFRYPNSYANKYEYQLGDGTLGTNNDGTDDARLRYNYTDPIFNSGSRIEGERLGLFSKRLVQGRHIDWFTNAELRSTDNTVNPVKKGQILEASSNFSRTDLPKDGIGGFAITAEDGTTYHYSLPVYNKKQYTKEFKESNYSTMTFTSPYAIEWLLTAITGSDFIDRNANGLADEADWGYWTKFEYGKYSDNYKWRSSYSSTGYSDKDVSQENFVEGVKEIYYLNTISTRSHTALFIKGRKIDGKSHYGTSPSNLGIDESLPVSSLYLNQIVTFNNEDFKKLTTANGIGAGIPAYTTSSGTSSPLNPDAAQGGRFLSSFDYEKNVYDVSDATTEQKSFIESNCTNTVNFYYDYSLCMGTPNSFTQFIPPTYKTPGVLSGKLTLKSIVFGGPKGTSLLPGNYAFEYNNENDAAYTYGTEKWDGWGMYYSGGIRNINGHRYALNTNDAKAWSLKKVINPMGSTIEVEYERDSYSSIADKGLTVNIPITGLDGNRIFFDISNLHGLKLNQILSNGQTVNLQKFWIFQKQTCWEPLSPNWQVERPLEELSSSQTVNNINDNSFEISRAGFCGGAGNTLTGCSACSFSSIEGYITVPSFTKNGGDLRVSKIIVGDGIVTQKVRYIYTQDGKANGITSGVVSKEPAFIADVDYDFYKWYDWPSTPVLYGKVTVLGGKLDTDEDFLSKTVYTFQTPQKDMIKIENQNTWTPQILSKWDNQTYWSRFSHQKNLFNIEVSTSKIGQLLWVQAFDKTNRQVASTALGYRDTKERHEGEQGLYREGTLLTECVKTPQDPGSSYKNYIHKYARTNKLYVPSVHTFTSWSGDQGSRYEIKAEFDFLSGEVVSNETKSSSEKRFATYNLLAYEKYPEMGSKVYNASNKNMMSQIAQSYLFKVKPAKEVNCITTLIKSNLYNVVLDNYVLPDYQKAGDVINFVGIDKYLPGGIKSYANGKILSISTDRKSFVYSGGIDINSPKLLIQFHPISSSIQTWSNKDSIRGYESGNYKNIANKVWRKQSTYVWNSPHVESDGIMKDFVDFNWTNSTLLNQYWMKASEITKYDQFSRPVEIRDVNGNYATSKFGYDKKHVISSVANSNYVSSTYDGFENIDSRTNYERTDGELYRPIGRMTQTASIKAHTGQYLVKVNKTLESHGWGPGYWLSGADANNLIKGKKYVASVWVHASSDAQTILNVGFNKVSYLKSIADAVLTCGQWKLIKVEFEVPANYSYNANDPNGLNILLWNNGTGDSYFDDFMLRPKDAQMTNTVYDHKTGLVTHVLDNNGLYVRNEYDSRNRVKAIYKETAKGEIKVKEFDYHYAGE
ncbi:MAG TPA: hypothetical protein VF691_18450 [Cytophagaceae bacterium]